ncbi:MAG: N-acetyltransferase [Flavobacteriaceae bacterium]|nr:N-acetyltransferase [Flavobacteriaceae bacterium]OUX40521.1 MAG: N-acetyltransferase [Flavobacteriaceae bacterium TMED265]
MELLEITDNVFLRQFEINIDGHLIKMEYAAQEKKIFLTKLVIPEALQDDTLADDFITAVLKHVQEKNLRVVPTSPQVAKFLRKNRNKFKEILPVGIRI